MSDERIQLRPYLKLLSLAGLIGFGSAVITFAFMWAVREVGHLIWQPVENTGGVWQPILTVLICAFAGIVVGVLLRIFGDHGGIFAELMQEFGRTGRFEYRHAPGVVVTAFVSLASGGGLGPEAPMAEASGSLGTWLSERLKMDGGSTRSLGFSGLSGMLGAFITSPFSGALLALESAKAAISYARLLFPSLVASAVATITFVLLTGEFFGNLYVFPEYSPRLIDLIWAIPLGLVGAAAGAVFILLYRILRWAMEPLRKRLVVRGLIGGLGLGVAGALLPLTLFSGEEQTRTLIERVGEYGVLMLVAIAVVKLLATSLLLTTGWKGGYIFPTMFAGVALGIAVHRIFPGVPLAVAVGTTMAGAMVTTMKAPLFSAVFTAMLVQREVAPAIAIAVVVGLLATSKLSMVPSAPRTEPPPEAAQPEAVVIEEGDVSPSD